MGGGDTATISAGAGPSVPIKADGPTFTNVIRRFREKSGEEPSNQLRATAVETVQKCLATYRSAFGPGEVGADGSGRTRAVGGASKSIQDRTTGLIYGRIQSGKTIAAIATTALASENGFRCVVVLTSDNVWLGDQTFERFRDEFSAGGPAVFRWEEWSKDLDGFVEDLEHNLPRRGAVLVTTKNTNHLRELLEALKRGEAWKYPGLVIDDEADNASLNTSLARQVRAKVKGTGEPIEDSRIFDAIGSLRKAVPHHIYLQVTATPQSLLLQQTDNPCRPEFCILSKAGPDYMGGELFFSEGSKFCVPVNEDELVALRGGKVLKAGTIETPEGLRKAICCFFIGSCYKLSKPPAGDSGIYSMLVHIDHKQVTHEIVEGVIRRFCRQLDTFLNETPRGRNFDRARSWLEAAYSELKGTAPDLPPLDEIVEQLRFRLGNARPEIIDARNPRNEPQYRLGMNILIGGNRLGRGITIKGLFVTYYGRDAQVKMTDTVLQHARMFGYRQYLMDVTRLFVPARIRADFGRIHDSDEGMRNAIGDVSDGNVRVTPVWVGARLVPTRANVLNPMAIGAFTPGRSIFPPNPNWRRNEVAAHTRALDKLLREYKEKGDDEAIYKVPIDFLIDVVKHMPSTPLPDKTYTWEDERVQRALAAMKAPPWNLTHGFLNVRTNRGRGLELSRQKSPPFKAFASSGWINRAKEKNSNAPTLIVMYQRGDKKQDWDDQPLYLPVLVLPQGKFVIMFSYT